MRRLIVVLTVLVFVLFCVDFYINSAQNRGIAKIKELGGMVLTSHTTRPGDVVHVHLKNAVFNDDDVRYIRDWTSLCSLNLSGTQVTDETLQQLSHLRELRVLMLAGTDVTDKGLERIGKFTELKILVLDDTNVTDAGLEHLRGLRMLEQLNLTGTRVSTTAVQELTNELPWVVIYQ